MMRRWKLLAALFGALTLVWWVGCANPNLAGGKLHFDQASRLEGADRTARFERARDTFIQAVKELPKSGEARLWLGKTYAELDQPDSAGANFDRAAQLSPEMAQEVKDTRDHYWSVKYNSGLTSASEALKSRQKGEEDQAKTALRDALRQLDKAAAYSPNRAETYTLMGKVYLNLAVLDTAITMLKKAQALSPDDTKMKDDLYLVYRGNGDKAYKSAAELLQSGDSTAAKAKYETAAEFYREADQVKSGEPDLNFQMGATAYELSDLDPAKKQAYLDEAIARYGEVLKDNPADTDVLYNMALTMRDIGKYEEAETYAARLVDINPKEHVYWDVLGRVRDKLGNKQGLVTGLVIGKALKDGTVLTEDAKDRANKLGAGNDLRRRYLESGAPDQMYNFTDTQGNEYDIWFYWTRGVVYGFMAGKEKYTANFAPQGVLTAAKCDLTTKGASKVVEGAVTNGSARKFSYVRAEVQLLDEAGDEINTVSTGSQKLDAHGTWTFEIPLSGDDEKATTVKVNRVVGY